MATCLLLDGNNLVYRAHYALERQHLRTKSGRPSGALFGFTRMLLRLLADEKPEYAAVAFDVAKETFRREIYPEYKATRRPTPPELLDQLPHSQELARRLGLRVLQNPRYEADDLIGSAAEMLKAHHRVVVVTGDRDLLQLIDERVTVKLCAKGITEMRDVDLRAFEEEYGFPPPMMVDLKALWGDSSDNIPGVAGIGEKKALSLIREFKSLEAVYEDLRAVGNERMRKQLEEGAERAILSQRLARIIRDLDNLGTIEDFRWKGLSGIDPEPVFTFFRDWDFHSMIPEQIRARAAAVAPVAESAGSAESSGVVPEPGEKPSTVVAGAGEKSLMSAPVPEELPLLPVPGEKLYVNRLEDLTAFFKTIGPTVCLDVETDGLNPFQNRIVGVALAGSPEKAVYIPLRHAYLGLTPGDQLTPEEVFPLLNRFLADKQVVGHHLKFDLAFLAREGVGAPERCYDTMLAAYVLDPSGQNGLKALARRLLTVDAVDFTQVARNRSFAEVPIDEAVGYACQDVILSMMLYERFQNVPDQEGFEKLFLGLEMPLVPILLEMEHTGIGLNREYLHALNIEVTHLLGDLEKAIHEAAGQVFNINSGKQLQGVLFDRLGLKPPKTTKTGFSTDIEVLRSLAGEHPVIGKLMEFRELMKLKTTYIDSLGSLVEPKTGLIHTSFNQTVTATGRLSSSNPNMQNIPIKTELGRKLRRAFIPPLPGHVLVSIDYSQIELRLLAHFSQDPGLLEAYRENLDIHSITASRIFGKSLDAVTTDERKVGKTVNFGIIYGISAFSLAEDLGISRLQAQAYIDQFFAGFPGVTAYFQRNLEQARQDGKVVTILGRVRNLPELTDRSQRTRAFGERVVRNTPLQGSAADLVKKAMLDVHALIHREGWKTKLILQIHDELVFSCPREEIAEVCPRLARCMEQALSLRVPLMCDTAVGDNLADLQDFATS
jgi:DNA polymerase-1